MKVRKSLQLVVNLRRIILKGALEVRAWLFLQTSYRATYLLYDTVARDPTPKQQSSPQARDAAGALRRGWRRGSSLRRYSGATGVRSLDWPVARFARWRAASIARAPRTGASSSPRRSIALARSLARFRCARGVVLGTFLFTAATTRRYQLDRVRPLQLQHAPPHSGNKTPLPA